MQRLRARIIEIKEIDRKSTGVETLCKVKILGKLAHDAFKFPDDTKDREHWVMRRFTPLWESKKDHEILLNPDETNDVVTPIQIEPVFDRRAKISIYEPDETVTELTWKADFGELGTVEGDAKRMSRFHLAGELTLPVNANLKPGTYRGKVECGDRKAIEVVLPVIAPGTSLLYDLDINRDGFDEKVMENTYLRVVVTPHHGAGLRQFWYKAQQLNLFAEVHHYGRGNGNKYLERGGHDDFIKEQEFPGELWNATYVEAETGKTVSRGAHATYRHEMQKTEGVTVAREIQLPADSPFVYQQITLSYAGGKEDKAETEKEKTDKPKKDEVEISYWARVMLGFGGSGTSDQAIKVPTQEKLHTWRVEDSEWNEGNEYFGFQAGFALAHDERAGNTFALFTHPQRVYYLRRWMLGELPEKPYSIQPWMKKVKLGVGKQVTYGLLYAAGSASACTNEAMAMLSEGAPVDEGIPVFIIARHVDSIPQCRARLSWDGGKAEIQLHGVNYTGVGQILQGKGNVPQAARPTLRVKVDVGGTVMEMSPMKGKDNGI